jgi:hypothetical protein
MFLSSAHLEALGHRYARIAGLKGSGERAAGEVLKTVETVGAAGLASYVNARYSEPGKTHYEVLGVPADLLGGILLGGASIFGFLGRFDEHGHNVANGALAAYAVRQGSIWGTNARVAHVASNAPSTAPATKGAFGVGAPRALYPTVDAQQHVGYGWEG